MFNLCLTKIASVFCTDDVKSSIIAYNIMLKEILYLESLNLHLIHDKVY